MRALRAPPWGGLSAQHEGKAPMKYGTSFPQDGLLTDPVATRDFAQAVEGLGYDFLTGSDRVLDKSPSAVRREPLVLLGYLAACTSRVELGTSIVITPQRQTVIVAKQMAELDVLSGGRVHLGIGLGYQEPEFRALNENIHNRGRRVEEQIEVMRALWTQPTVTFNGKWHHIDGLGIALRPSQQPIPIWMGGTVEVALRRIGEAGGRLDPALWRRRRHRADDRGLSRLRARHRPRPHGLPDQGTAQHHRQQARGLAARSRRVGEGGRDPLRHLAERQRLYARRRACRDAACLQRGRRLLTSAAPTRAEILVSSVENANEQKECVTAPGFARLPRPRRHP